MFSRNQVKHWRGVAPLFAVALVACGAPSGFEAPAESGLAEWNLPVASRQGAIRPTDGKGWHDNGYGAVKVESYDPPSGMFRIHFTREGEHAVPATDSDGDGVPDFVTMTGRIFDEVYKVEVSELGLRQPLSDAKYHDRPDFGGDGKFDVYLQDRGGSSDGYIVTESCKPGPPLQCAGYMVVENDFVGYSYPTPEDGMKVLASHEFFHIVQKAHRSELGQAFSEGTAVWATERVYPEQKDFEHFIPGFFAQTDRPINDTPNGQVDGYPYATGIWPKFLAEAHGDGLIKAVFEELAKPVAELEALDAIDAVLARDHGSSLAKAFAEFALWNLLTGKRATSEAGYAEGSKYPMVEPDKLTDPHPFRITGEIDYLSSRYYSFAIEAGHEVTATAEREEGALALHLVTGEGDTTVIARGEPGAKEVTIVSKGNVLIVAASTARKGRGLPLSIAVRAKAGPPPSDDGGAPPAPDAGPAPSGDGGATHHGDDDGGGGCAVTGAAKPGALTGLLLAVALLGFARRGRRRLVAALATFVALAAVGCGSSDDNPSVDAGVDGAPAVDSGPADGAETDTAVDSTLVPDAPAPLLLGGFVELTADDKGQVSGSVPVSGKETLLLLLMSDDDKPLSQHDYQLEVGPDNKAMSLPPEAPRASGDAELPAKQESHASSFFRCRFHERLKAVVGGATGKPWRAPKPYAMATLPPKVGDKREFLIRSGMSHVTINAEALHVDGTAAYWIDRTTNPLASIPQADLEGLAKGFSEIIVPRERAYFGRESDIDSNGVIFVLLSPLVAKTGAIAYVQPCDLVDPKTSDDCKVSNNAEILYLSPPSSLKPPYNTVTALLETAAHEFQHAIYFYRKYVLNNTVGQWENIYITEGLSHLAQDLSGYQAGNLYVVKAVLDAIDLVALPNVTSKEVGQLGSGDDGLMRGAGYLLLRFLFDQAGGDSLDPKGAPVDAGGISWLRGFIDQPELGTPSVVKSSKRTYPELVARFWTTIALSNRVAGGKPVSEDPSFSFQATSADPFTGRQRGCDLFGATHAGPINGPAIQELAAADGKVRPGGAELIQLKPEAGSSSLKVTVKAAAAAKAKARLIRIR